MNAVTLQNNRSAAIEHLAVSGGLLMRSSDAARFREQSEYCRRQAQKAMDQADKEAWLKIAADWMQMAMDAERLAQKE